MAPAYRMVCPACNNSTNVVDSRATSEGATVRRRRECNSCSFRFSTLEELRLLDLVVIKRDGERQPYRPEKIETGLKIALQKRNFSGEDFQKLLRQIELEIASLKAHEVTSLQIGEVVMDKLRSFDTVAYIRFASVYRQFEDVQTFENELRALK